LNDDDWTPETRLGAGRLHQVGPPDLALGDHQSERSSVRRESARADSPPEETASQTRSKLSVMLSAE
jgi:hypothetical protein